MDGEVRSALTYPSLLRCSALRPTADVKVRSQLAPGEPLCTREWGICSHLEQAGKSGQIHSWLHQAEPAHQTNQWQHQEIPCLVQIPSWVLWRGPHMASTSKNELAPPYPPALTTPAPSNPFGSVGSPAVLAAGRAGDLETWDALCLGTRSRALGPVSPPQHYVMSLSSQQCLGLHVGA